jgi:hypothetical protein
MYLTYFLLYRVSNWADDISSKIVEMWEDISGYQHLKKVYLYERPV